jgi:ribosome maturation factor RimP
MSVSLVSELIALLEPLADQHGLELVTVEVTGGQRHQTVRVFLDREGGIDIDAVAGANAWISDSLDSVSRLNGAYTLEVSSPGIERVLRKREDFTRFAGERVAIHMLRTIDGRSRLTGQLIGVEGDDVVVEFEGQEHRVPFDAIERARLKADFGEAGGRNG